MILSEMLERLAFIHDAVGFCFWPPFHGHPIFMTRWGVGAVCGVKKDGQPPKGEDNRIGAGKFDYLMKPPRSWDEYLSLIHI